MRSPDNDNPQSTDTQVLNKSGQPVKEPFNENRLISPIERVSEILFGLIMALSFTCAISVAETDRIPFVSKQPGSSERCFCGVFFLETHSRSSLFQPVFY
jgi:hypothetical protein